LTRDASASTPPGGFADPDVYARATIPPFDRLDTNASLRPADDTSVVASAVALSVARAMSALATPFNTVVCGCSLRRASHVGARQTLRERRHIGGSSLRRARQVGTRRTFREPRHFGGCSLAAALLAAARHLLHRLRQARCAGVRESEWTPREKVLAYVLTKCMHAPSFIPFRDSLGGL
jgi:hypothetical protein